MRAGLLSCLLILAGLGLLGAPCTPPPPPPPEALVYFWNPSSTVRVGTGTLMTVRVYSEETPVQAFDLGLDFDSDYFEVTQVFVGDFDDVNHGLAVTPSIDLAQGTVRNIVDFRHGTATEIGTSTAFQVAIRGKSEGTGTLTLVSAGVSDASGEPFEVSSIPISISFVP
jgi:hypothetical protein